MKRGNPFDVLMRLRRIDERHERIALAGARAAHDQARERLEEYKARYRDALEIEDLLTPIELRSLQLRGIRSHEDLMAAAEEFARARHALDDRIDGWRKSASDLDAAERLDQKRKEEAARGARVAADRVLDDLLGIMHNRQSEASS